MYSVHIEIWCKAITCVCAICDIYSFGRDRKSNRTAKISLSIHLIDIKKEDATFKCISPIYLHPHSIHAHELIVANRYKWNGYHHHEDTIHVYRKKEEKKTPFNSLKFSTLNLDIGLIIYILYRTYMRTFLVVVAVSSIRKE